MIKNNTKNENWVIFYQKDGHRYYFLQMYTIGRLRFSKKQFTIFKSIFEVNDTLQKITDSFKLYYPRYKLKGGMCDVH